MLTRHRLLWLSAATVLLGCASTSTTRVSRILAPLPEATPVAVYLHERDAPPHTTVAAIDYENPGKWQSIGFDHAADVLRSEARRVGANAVIVDSRDVIVSGIASRGIRVHARAVLVREPAQ
jgi:hypothetical protein